MSNIIECQYCGRPTDKYNSSSTCPFMGHEWFQPSEHHPMDMRTVQQMQNEIRMLQLTLHYMASKLGDKKDEYDHD